MTNTIKRWRAMWQPEMYHGWGRTERYFEGWYFKIVDNTEGVAFAFIPGISMSPEGVKHAFIQVLDGKNLIVAYHTFATEEFNPSSEKFEVWIGRNYFSTEKIILDLPNIKGTLHFENTTPWVKSLGAPGIMGWFSFVPMMECYHGIVSLDHSIKGGLEINNKKIDFNKGRGYIEKDWGISFPKGWIWLQSNHFGIENKPESTSLIASVAHIPWLGTHFIGYIVGFWWEGHLYRFATYTGAKMKAKIVDNQIFIQFKDSRYQLDIEATKAGTGSLVAPIQGNMTGKVSESLQAILHVKFYDRGNLVFDSYGRNAGLEAAGAVDILLTDTWRR